MSSLLVGSPVSRFKGLLVFLSALAACAWADLGYVECSDGFRENPRLEGGRTELEFADINNDGNVDILCIGDHGNPRVNTLEHGVMVWFGDGHGNWSVFQYGEFGYGGIAVGDVNWDGCWDIGYGMHHNYSGVDLGDDMLEVALGDGTGRMWTAWDDSLIPGGAVWGEFSTDFADVDNDGDLDVGSTSFGYGFGARVFLNQGDGTWRESFSTPTEVNNSIEFYLRDVNRDGNADIIHGAAEPAVYFGDGAGGFVPGDSGLPQGTRGLAGISPGDIDNDGGFDVAFANSGGGVEAWVWNGAARRWQSRSSGLPTSGDFEGTQLCDMDADGLCDLVAIGGQVKVWKGDGEGNWTEAATIPVPAPGYYTALRAGADFDHNGRPDIAFVTDEGTWPNDRNYAHAFREASPVESLGVLPVFPRGGEKFANHSAQLVDWWSEAPSAESTRVRLELSTSGPAGPWRLVADSLRNSGRYQWLVPDSVASENCFLRLTLTGPSGSASAMTPRPFAIGDTVVGVADRAFPRGLSFAVSPNPARGQVCVKLGGPAVSPGRLSLFDAGGRRVREAGLNAGANEARVSLDRLPAGAYLVLLESGGRRRLGRLCKMD